MSSTLTKKQQKAQAFRAKQKQKAKGADAPEDVPEADLDEAVEAVEAADGAADGAAVEGRKRKRGPAEDEEGGEGEGKKSKDKAKAKGKAKTAWDEDEGEDEGGERKKAKKEPKQRFILFVGNLDYKTTREDVQAHFKEAVGRVPSVRLLTHRPGSGPGARGAANAPPKSRGIAFLELASSDELQLCLRLHGSRLAGRTVNVELTAGGGGKGEARRGKLEERKKRVGGQRERRAEREAEEGGGEGGEGERAAEGGAAEPADGAVKGRRSGGQARAAPAEDAAAPDGYKMRGGRRVKAKDEGTQSARGGQQGWARREQGGGAPRQGGQGGRRKWEPTGANAMSVG